MKRIILLILFSLCSAFFVRAEIEEQTSKDVTGYVIQGNDDDTYVIDVGLKDGISLDNGIIIYTKDETVDHPVTGEVITIRGKQVAKGIILDCYDNFSLILVTENSERYEIEPGYFVRIVNSDTKTNIFARNRRGKLKFKTKSETTLSTMATTGLYGSRNVMQEEFYIGYRFPSKYFVNVEVQLSQYLHIFDLYSSRIANDFTVYAFANTVVHFDFWKENGGVGLAFGGGFTRTGFSGNTGIIVGNMNRTGLQVYFYGLWNKAIFTDIDLSIYINKVMNIDSKISYSYWLNADYMTHGIQFRLGPTIKIGKYVYLKMFGGITNTLDKNFGGVGGLGIKMVL